MPSVPNSLSISENMVWMYLHILSLSLNIIHASQRWSSCAPLLTCNQRLREGPDLSRCIEILSWLLVQERIFIALPCIISSNLPPHFPMWYKCHSLTAFTADLLCPLPGLVFFCERENAARFLGTLSTKWKHLVWKRRNIEAKEVKAPSPDSHRSSHKPAVKRQAAYWPAVLGALPTSIRIFFLEQHFTPGEVLWQQLWQRDRYLVLAIKPCYFQIAGTGNEIWVAGLTCGEKISSCSATRELAKFHTCNVLFCL